VRRAFIAPSTSNAARVSAAATMAGRPLAGEVVVFTGFRDAALARRVAALGGVYRDGLSKAVTTVVCADAATLTTNKARAARERGLRVLTRDEFAAAPAASGGVVDFADAGFLAAAGLPPPGLSAAATRAHGIRLVLAPAAAPAAAPPLGSSRVGGAPDLPPGLAWPRCGGQPMQFLAQLDLSRASLLDGCAALPRHGWLLFFVAADYTGEPGASGSAPGGTGGGFGDTAHDVAAALAAADAGPADCALAPSRVLFVAPMARLARAAWPADLPPPLRLQPRWLAHFEAGGGGGGGEEPAAGPSAAGLSAVVAPSRKRQRAEPPPPPPPLPRKPAVCSGGGGGGDGGAAAAAAAAAGGGDSAASGGDRAGGCSSGVCSQCGGRVGGDEAPAPIAPLAPQLLGRPGGDPARGGARRIARCARQMWRDIHGVSCGGGRGAEEETRMGAGGGGRGGVPNSGGRRMPPPAEGGGGVGDGAQDEWLLLLQLERPPPAGGDGRVDDAGAGATATTAATAAPAAASSQRGGRSRQPHPRAAAPGGALSSSSSPGRRAPAAASNAAAAAEAPARSAAAAFPLATFAPRYFFMLRACDLASKTFVRHLLVVEPPPGGLPPPGPSPRGACTCAVDGVPPGRPAQPSHSAAP
jgi:hypothetical protein